MAETVSSAIVQETVSQIISALVHKHEGKDNSNANEDLERLEMAHIKLEAALETSRRWQITDASLLRWRKKLKRAAQECGVTLQKRKQIILEQEQKEQEVRKSSFPKRIGSATMSFVCSIFSRNNNELTRSTVRRFEWFADGASEFLRFIELGGTLHYHVPFDPLIRHLLTGKKLQHKIIRAGECPTFLLWVPFITADYGTEASLIFMQQNGKVPENEFFLSVMLQISESTDVVGTAIKCLQLFSPLFKSTVEIVRKELMQLPTQDFSWVPYVHSDQKEHWENLHSFGTQWFRPNPLCCKQHDRHEPGSSGKAYKSELPDVSLEPVIEVNLQCRVSPCEYNLHRTSLSVSEDGNSLQDPPQLKAGLLFMPHGSSEDSLPVTTSSAVQVINGEEHHCLHTDISLQQLEEIMLPAAVDYFSQNPDASVYQMLWKSKHGTAYAQVQNTSTRKMIRRARKGKLSQREYQGLESRTHVIPQFIQSWVAHAPIRLQGLIADWIQKEKKKQLAPPPLCLKF